MNTRIALFSLVAFCGALAIGRLVLPAQTNVNSAQQAPSEVPLAVASSAEYLRLREADAFKPYYEIDTTIKAVDGGAENDNVRMTHFIAANYQEGLLHKSKHQFGAWLRWVPTAQEIVRDGKLVAQRLAASPKGKLSGQGPQTRYTFEGTYPQTNERFHIREDGGLEHDILLAEAPQGIDDSYGLAYSGYLQMRAGLTLWDEQNGNKQITGNYRTPNAIHVKNEFGNTVFLIRRPMAYDAQVTLADGTLDKEKQAETEHNGRVSPCEYVLEFTDHGIKFAVETPAKWLLDPERAYPVTIDPNTGPLGLRDGTFPIYIATPGSKPQIPLHTFGTPILGEDPCNNGRDDLQPKPDNDYGMIQLPFDFNYYNQIRAAGTQLFVHFDGWASFIAPYPKYCPPPPCRDRTACFDHSNVPIPSGGAGTRDDAMYAYWDDLRVSSAEGSGLYYFLDGVKPNRRLVIEWHKMGFVDSTAGGGTNDVISFNLILYECDSKIEFIIGATDEVDPGRASVGIENQNGSRGIQYDYNSSLTVPPGTPPTPPGQVPDTTAIEPIPPNTSVLFEFAPTSNIIVQFTALNGCRPHKVCFSADSKTVQSTCDLNKPGQTFGFHWKFLLQPRTGAFGSGVVDPVTGKVLLHEGFTARYCQTFTIPGSYDVVLEVTDRLGIVSTYPEPIQVLVCDTPQVVISATPQGGPAPLDVEFETHTARDDLLQITRVVYVFDQLGVNNDPGEFTNVGTATVNDGDLVNFRFEKAGIYRVRVFYDGTDVITNLATQGSGTIFIFVTNPNQPLEDAIIITESQVKIDWKGKVDGADPDGQAPNIGSSIPGDGLPDNPNRDQIFARGFINLAGQTLSGLVGRRVRCIGNGSEILLDGQMDASGKVISGDPATGKTAEFGVSMPSGKFYFNTRGDLYGALSLSNATERRILPIHYRFEIEGGAFPPVGTTGAAVVTYDYKSIAGGGAKGIYKFGGNTNHGAISGAKGFKRPGGQTLLVSGGLMVTDATLTLEGGLVYAELRGKIARAGGDDIRLAEDSNIRLALNTFDETLNPLTSPVFKVSGKAPRQKISFKRSTDVLGQTGIAQFSMVNGAGDFYVKTYGIPNEQINLNPAAPTQILTFGLTITQDNHVTTTGAARFEVQKIDDRIFSRNSKE